jgi:hypothetical protein
MIKHINKTPIKIKLAKNKIFTDKFLEFIKNWLDQDFSWWTFLDSKWNKIGKWEKSKNMNWFEKLYNNNY